MIEDASKLLFAGAMLLSAGMVYSGLTASEEQEIPCGPD